MNENAVGQKGGQGSETDTFFTGFIFFFQARDVAEASQCLFPS